VQPKWSKSEGSTSKRIRLGKAWRFSKIPYEELVFRSFMQSRGTGSYQPVISFGNSKNQMDARERMIRRMIKSAKWNKLAVATVVAFASGIPLISYALRPEDGILLAGSSLSLMMLFGYCILYGIQILPGLISSDFFVILEALPLSVNDVSIIATLSLIRTMDYILIAGIATPTVLILILTHSVLGATIEFIATSVDLIFAIAAALYLSRFFYRNLSGGVRTRIESVLRLGFVLGWGLLIMGLGFFYNYVNYVSPFIEAALTGKSSVMPFALLAIHPFSFSFVLASSIFSTSPQLLMVSIFSVCAYTLLAIYALKWSLSVTPEIDDSRFSKIKRQHSKDFRFNILHPVLAYAVKDFRIVYRNPSTAFLIAAPIFETVVVILPLISAHVLGTLPTLLGTFIGGLFSSFTTVGLLNAEGAGFDYTRTLPIPLKATIWAKALAATITFLPVPLIFAIISYFKPMTHNLLYIIPLISIPSVASASMAEISVFLAMAGAGRMIAFNPSSGMIQFSLAMLVGAALVGIPLMALGIIQLMLHDMPLSINLLAILSSGEFLIMFELSSRRN
jgi:predicted permease